MVLVSCLGLKRQKVLLTLNVRHWWSLAPRWPMCSTESTRSGSEVRIRSSSVEIWPSLSLVGWVTCWCSIVSCSRLTKRTSGCSSERWLVQTTGEGVHSILGWLKSPVINTFWKPAFSVMCKDTVIMGSPLKGGMVVKVVKVVSCYPLFPVYHLLVVTTTSHY